MATSAPCPKCKSTDAKPVTFTWWGGLVGPKLISHVRCQSCGGSYNGKTGKPNTVAIAIYIGVTTLLALILVVVLVMSKVFTP